MGLRFNDGSISVNTELRFAKLDIDPAFAAEGVQKAGPHGGRIRYSRGEWKTYEQDQLIAYECTACKDDQGRATRWSLTNLPPPPVQVEKVCPKCGKQTRPILGEVEISDEDVKYFQEFEGKKVEVQPFDSTKTWDILAPRNLDECTLDGPVALGTLIPLEKIDEFGPDKDRGSSLYWISGDAFALRALVGKLEKEKLALYFPHIFRKGLTIHLAVAYVVRIEGKVYLIMRTFGGSTIWSHPVSEVAAGAPTIEKKIVVLARPVLRRKATQGTL
jgi:hypothetical protein